MSHLVGDAGTAVVRPALQRTAAADLGVVLAMVIPLLFAVSVPVASVRPIAVMCGMFSVLALLAFGGNAFGIR